MNIARNLTLLILIQLVSSSLVYADLYRCTTGRGTTNITNVPCLNIAEEKLDDPAVEKAKQYLPPPNRSSMQRYEEEEKELKKKELANKQAVKISVEKEKQAKPSLRAVTAPAKVIQVTRQAAAFKKAPTNTQPPLYNEVTIPHELQTKDSAKSFSATQYRVGMQWVLRTTGIYTSFEHYEIIAIDGDMVSWRRTLLNARKQPFAGGISEDFVFDQQHHPDGLSTKHDVLNMAGFELNTQHRKSARGVFWYISSLPLITPFIRYRSGDQTVMIEFHP